MKLLILLLILIVIVKVICNDNINVYDTTSSPVFISNNKLRIINSETKQVIARHILDANSNPTKLLVKNPGIWRWIFETESLEEIRFQDFCMAEDQDFLADLNPKLDKMLISSSVTYKYAKGWRNQLTFNQNAVNQIFSSIHYLEKKIENKTANDWHKKFIMRQILTGIKRGSWKVKIAAIRIAAKMVWKNAR